MILAISDLNVNVNNTAFLKYVLNQTLADEAQNIKDDTIASDVFGRGPDFDKRIDPIVSIRVDQLRRGLKRYFRAVGKNHPIRIDIPNGTYVPVFEKRELNEP